GSVEIDAHLKAATNGKNPLRHRLLMMHDCFQEDGDYAGYTAEMVDNDLKEKSNGMVRLDGAKFFQDGSIQGYTGALRNLIIANLMCMVNLFMIRKCSMTTFMTCINADFALPSMVMAIERLGLF